MRPSWTASAALAISISFRTAASGSLNGLGSANFTGFVGRAFPLWFGRGRGPRSRLSGQLRCHTAMARPARSAPRCSSMRDGIGLFTSIPATMLATVSHERLRLLEILLGFHLCGPTFVYRHFASVAPSAPILLLRPLIFGVRFGVQLTIRPFSNHRP